MDRKQFLHACTLINSGLVNQVMDRTFNSVGSNVFFEFGKQEEFILPNKKKVIQKEWSIWLSWTSWRISRYNKYVVGSGEEIEVNIQKHLERILGKRLQSFHFISQYLDVEFVFEDGYKISTFFNRTVENQWLVFLPDKTELIIDCSSDEAIKNIQDLSKQVRIENKFKETISLLAGTEVKEVFFNENEISSLICTDGFSMDLGLSTWRLGKNDAYYIGRLDYYFGCLEGQMAELQNKLLLVGKKIKHMGVDPSGMDARLEFEGGYVLEIFTHARTNSWKICSDGKPIFSANIQLSEEDRPV